MFPEELIGGLFTGLAIAGAVALILRLVRSVAGMLLAFAAFAAAGSIAEQSGRRGDLTGMQEGFRARRAARSTLVMAGATAALWLLWLAVPVALDLIPAAYAAAAVLWMLPRRPSAPLPPSETAGDQIP